MTMNKDNLPSLKDCNKESERVAKGLNKSMDEARNAARHALLYTMYAANDLGQPHYNSEPLTRLHAALMEAATARMTKDKVTMSSNLASRFAAWVNNAAPSWVWNQAQGVFKKRTAIKGIAVRYEINEAVFDVDFDKFVAAKVKTDIEYTEAKLITAIGNLKAKAVEKGLDFGHAMAVLENKLTQAQQASEQPKVVGRGRRGKQGEAKIVPITQADEQQTDALAEAELTVETPAEVAA